MLARKKAFASTDQVRSAPRDAGCSVRCPAVVGAAVAAAEADPLNDASMLEKRLNPLLLHGTLRTSFEASTLINNLL
jgi:hypothetical protein